MHWNAFLEELAGWFAARDLLTAGSRWVVGVSGGPDSTLLVHAMHGLSEGRGLGWRLHLAHFNHGLRGAEADEDERFVGAWAERLNLPLHVEREDIRARQQKEGGSTEEVARRHRYELLERVALRTDSAYVAVAHHADDNAETILHRICRGTGIRGLAGISDVRPIQPGSRVVLVRPLLQQRRAMIDALCAAQGFNTREDSSNRSGEFTRNRIRQAVLPVLREQLNPNVSDALLRLAEQARWLGGYLDEAAARTFESLLVTDVPGQIVLRTPALLSKHRAVQAEVIRRAIALAAGGEQETTFGHVDAVLRLAADPASGKEVHLPGPVIVQKQYERLVFGPPQAGEPAPEVPPVLVECPGVTALPGVGYELTAEITPVEGSKADELRRWPQPLEEWLDFARVRPPLVVRGRREGDRFHPLGAPGAKSLSDFLIDEKVAPHVRARTGVLCDQEGPIWVMPLRIDERVKLTGNTRQALHLVLRPLNPRQVGVP